MYGSPLTWARTLGLTPGKFDEKQLKSAYAAAIKGLDTTAEPAKFQEIREAFEGLRRTVRRAKPAPTKDASSAPSPSKPDGEKREAPLPRRSLRRANTQRPAPPAFDPKPAPERRTQPAAQPRRPIDTKETIPQEPPRGGPIASGDSAEIARIIEHLGDQITPLLSSPFSANGWRQFFDDPHLLNIRVAEQVEARLLREASRLVRLGEASGATLPPGLGPDAIRLINERFGWFENAQRLQRKYGFGAKLLIDRLIETEVERGALATNPQRRQVGGTNWREALKPKVYASAFGALWEYIVSLSDRMAWFYAVFIYVVWAVFLSDLLLDYLVP